MPTRQYFGKNIGEEEDGAITRTVYGVGSGSSTVGADVKTTTTKPLTTVMNEIIEELHKIQSIKVKNQKYCKENFDLNHATVLYYLLDKKESTTCRLNKHCDVEVTASNTPKSNNSQKVGTPTIVISLNNTKHVWFYKRYTTDNKSFDGAAVEVDRMEMKHGEKVFVRREKAHR